MTTSDTHRALRAFDHHGRDLHAVARLLTTDPELAERLVLLAVTTAAPTDGLRGLSALVVRGWLDGHPEQLETITPAASTVLDRVHDLSVHHRASLALCRFGDHTYREAADVLALPPVEVLDLLTDAVRSLRPAPPAPDVVTDERAV